MPKQPHSQNQNNELQELEDQEAIALKNFLAQQTQRWQQIRQERGNESAKKELLHGTRLERVVALRRAGAFERVGGLREAENELLDASLARRDRQNQSARKPNRRQILSLSIFSGVALLLALLAGWQWQRAEKQQKIAEKQSIISQARAGQVLYLLGNRLEALVETLKAYQQLQKTPWPATGEFIQIRRTLHKFVYPDSAKLLNSITVQHPNEVTQVVFSPDSNAIAATGRNGIVKLWSRQGALQQTLKHQKSVEQLLFSPDGETIVTSSHKTVKLWDRQGSLQQTLSYQNPVTHVTFSPNGKTIATSSHETVKLWDRQGSLQRTLQDEGSINHITFSPNGKIIAVASDDGTVKLWNRQGQLQKVLKQPYNEASQVTFSPKGKLIATASVYRSRGTLKLWNRQGELKHTLQSGNRVYNFSFSPNGQTIAANIYDEGTKLWNLQGELKQTLFPKNYIVFSTDGSTISSYKERSQLANLFEGQKQFEFEGQKQFERDRIAFNKDTISPDGNTIVTTSEGTIKLWNWHKKQIHTPQHKMLVGDVVFDSDVRILTARKDTVEMWDSRGNLLQKFPHKNKVLFISASASGDTIASVTANRQQRISTKYKLKLWNRQGQLLQTVENEKLRSHYRAGLTDLAIAPNGKMIVSMDSDSGRYRRIKLWNRQGKLLQKFERKGKVRMTFSPEGKIFAFANKNEVRLWSQQDKFKQTLKHENSIRHIVFSPNGKTIASAADDKTVKLWNRQGELLQTLQHENRINQVAFSPDGEIVATVSNDVKLWNRQGELLQTLQHESKVNNIAFSPNGEIVATASNRIAFTPNSEIIASASDRVKLWNRQGELLQTLEYEASANDRISNADGGNGETAAFASNGIKLWNRQGELLQTFEYEGSLFQGPKHSDIFTFGPNGDFLLFNRTLWGAWEMKDMAKFGCQWLQEYAPPEKRKNLTICDSLLSDRRN